MGPESFENSIQKKFENQTIKAPKRVWGNIENSLNADFVAMYASQHSMYKWVSVAAVFIAVLLLGALAFPVNPEINQQNSDSYNALLENNWDYSNYYPSFLGYEPASFSFTPISAAAEEDNSSPFEENILNETSKILILNTRRLSLPQADVQPEIYPYYYAGIGRAKRKETTNDNQKMWAGVAAGAGTFNPDFSGSNVLSNSLKPAGLASAVGSGSFVNPTTNIQQEMEQGVATSIGIDFGVALGKKWTLESGLAYTSMDNRGSASINVLDVYTIDNQDLINENGGIDDGVQLGVSSREATIEIEENYDHQIDINNSVQFASIPIKAGFFVLNKKISLRLNAGLSANYLVEGNLSDPTREILNIDELNLYNEWSFDGVGGFELGYSIFNKFDLTIEPNYRHSITPISNSVNSPSRFLVQTGFRYTLR